MERDKPVRSVCELEEKVFYMEMGAPEATWTNIQQLPLREY